MKVKTTELTGPALDWAVAKCGGHDAVVDGGEVYVWETISYESNKIAWKPSINWAQGGPIIEREELSHLRCFNTNEWNCDNGDVECYGTTPLQAAMRCYVSCRIGEEIEIPDELREKMKMKELLAEATEEFYKWEEREDVQGLSDDDRLLWIRAWVEGFLHKGESE